KNGVELCPHEARAEGDDVPRMHAYNGSAFGLCTGGGLGRAGVVRDAGRAFQFHVSGGVGGGTGGDAGWSAASGPGGTASSDAGPSAGGTAAGDTGEDDAGDADDERGDNRDDGAARRAPIWVPIRPPRTGKATPKPASQGHRSASQPMKPNAEKCVARFSQVARRAAGDWRSRGAAPRAVTEVAGDAACRASSRR